MTNEPTKLTVFISTPLEQEHVDELRVVAPDEIDVLYEPDLLPPTRYVADHKGDEAFERSPEQEQRWQQHPHHAMECTGCTTPTENITDWMCSFNQYALAHS